MSWLIRSARLVLAIALLAAPSSYTFLALAIVYGLVICGFGWVIYFLRQEGKPSVRGKGYTPPFNFVDCPRCDGVGVTALNGDFIPLSKARTVASVECSLCDGNGLIPEHRKGEPQVYWVDYKPWERRIK